MSMSMWLQPFEERCKLGRQLCDCVLIVSNELQRCELNLERLKKSEVGMKSNGKISCKISTAENTLKSKAIQTRVFKTQTIKSRTEIAKLKIDVFQKFTKFSRLSSLQTSVN